MRAMNEYTDMLKERLIVEFARHDRSGVYGYTQRKMSYNSNRIEGSTLTEKQTASIFYTGTVESDTDSIVVRTKDIEEMTGHFSMFNEMLKTYNEPLSGSLIKRYHYALKSGVFEDVANGYPIGEYKNRRNIVSDVVTCPPEKVEEEINRLFEWYESTEEKTLSVLAELHIRYERIHPFQDGNGRTGRLILYKECLRNGICPFVIEDSQKHEYYKALGDVQELTKLFVKEQEIYKDSTLDMVVPVPVPDRLGPKR